ncbi:MAG: MmcQ/YjbR family DNA-binding protein [Anaerolineae bacterium]
MSDHAQTGISFDTARQIALSFPGVEEGESFGAPVFRLRKGLILSPAGREKGNILALKVGKMEAEFMIEAEPDVYYNTEHYRIWCGVLIRMDNISAAEFRYTFEKAWRRLATKRAVAAYDAAK